jgi:hypothetical protein
MQLGVSIKNSYGKPVLIYNSSFLKTILYEVHPLGMTLRAKPEATCEEIKTRFNSGVLPCTLFQSISGA